MPKIMMVAGEASGDMHGALLARELRSMVPDISISGMGGVAMASAGVEILVDTAGMAVMGVSEVFGQLGKIRAALKTLTQYLLKKRPDLLILIDYPGFNLMMAGRAKRLGIPVFYYISPKVWAWRTGRVKKIREVVDRMAVILPFEKEFYRRYGMAVDFVGNPLVDAVRPTQSREQVHAAQNIGSDTTVIGILPGSRRQEIASLLPNLLRAAEIISQNLAHQRVVFFLPLAPGLDREELMNRGLGSVNLDIRVVAEQRYEMMQACDVAMAASGTVTLELAILGIPMVVVYRVKPMTWAIGRRLVKINYVSLVNLVAGREVVPELLQHQATPEKIAAQVCQLLSNPNGRTAMQAGLAEVRKRLGTQGASRRTARLALEMIGYA